MRTKALLLALAFASVCMAKDIKTVMLTTNPEMHCNNCEKKIKENIRFEAGVKKIETNLEKQLVVITYDPAKTDSKKLTEAFAQIGYSIKVISDEPATTKHKTKKRA